MHRTQVPWEAYVRRFEDAFDRYKKGPEGPSVWKRTLRKAPDGHFGG